MPRSPATAAEFARRIRGETSAPREPLAVSRIRAEVLIREAGIKPFKALIEALAKTPAEDRRELLREFKPTRPATPRRAIVDAPADAKELAAMIHD